MFRFKTVLIGCALLLPLFIIGWLMVAKIKGEDHYDIKKYSLEWLVVMNNKVVSNYPIINPYGKVQYNWKGYNHTPYSIVEWNVEYVSSEKPSKILNDNIDFFKQHNYQLTKADGVACSWETFENTSYYSTNRTDCLTLALTPQKNNKTRVRFYFIKGT